MEEPPKLKIKLVSWNMNMMNRLPQGDLAVLLGSVPPYSPLPHCEGLPQLALDDAHPYHLIVIAGQECPTPSGLPLAGMKFGKPGPNGEIDKASQAEYEKFLEKEKVHHHVGESKGWSDYLEDYLSRGIKFPGQSNPQVQVNPATPPISEFNAEQLLGKENVHHLKAPSTESAESGASGSSEAVKNSPVEGTNALLDIKGKKNGSYEFVAKERLLGIYLCVYVWRGCKTFIKGTSSSYVTTGLIGGRFGNKGAVAISINMAGTKLLFINAHLAAHANRVDTRLANIEKIKRELVLNDFLGDASQPSDDVTEKFDTTFWMGDLNFRLDVTRLHADWLISRKEYEQALKFDQLTILMQEGLGFPGFQEAVIDFPPTYKYDVKKKSVARRPSRKVSQRHVSKSIPGEEVAAGDKTATVVEDDEDTDIDLEQSDRNSIMSSGWTSVAHSIHTSDDEAVLSDGGSQPDLSTSALNNPGQAIFDGVQKIFLPSTAIKAKKRIIGMLKLPPASPNATGKPSPRKFSGIHAPGSTSSASTPPTTDRPSLELERSERSNSLSAASIPPAPSTSPTPPPPSRGQSIDLGNRPVLRRELSARLKRTFIPKSEDVSDDEDAPDDGKGVYDTSEKQRVPSWCDRILFKSYISDYPLPTLSRSPSTSTHESRLSKIASVFHLKRRDSHELDAHRLSAASLSETDLHSTPLIISSKKKKRMPLSHSKTMDVPREALKHNRMRSTSLDVTTSFPPPSMSTAAVDTSPRPLMAMRPSFSTTPMPISATSEPIAQSQSSLPLASPGLTITPVASPLQTPTLHHVNFAGSSSADTSEQDVNASRPDVTPLQHRPLQSEHTLAEIPPVEPESVQHDKSWLYRILPFTSNNRSSHNDLTTYAEEEARRARPKKGQVECISYGTLNDEEMMKLRGMSDHRPIMGSYTINI